MEVFVGYSGGVGDSGGGGCLADDGLGDGVLGDADDGRVSAGAAPARVREPSERDDLRRRQWRH